MTNTSTGVPSFAALPQLADTGERSAWGVFGDDDELGTLNFITPEAVAAAAASVQHGRVVALALPLDVPSPPLAEGRADYCHEIERARSGRDERLDGFYPQGSTQWDGLGHIRFRELGYYNGRSEADLDAGGLGIDALARRGIIARGVLVDYAGWLPEAHGHDVDPTARAAIAPEELDSVLDWQGTEIARGDVLVLRTGWLEWYLRLPAARRRELAGSLHNRDGGLQTPGLAPGQATAAWLWDRGIAAVAADNPSLEALRVSREEGFLHRRILALLGMPIGELWLLDELARVCGELGRRHFLLSASPWRLPRGNGSPVTPHAVL